MKHAAHHLDACRQPTTALAQPVEISTTAGCIQGISRDGLHIFRGVRYAAPCSMATRFDVPRPLPAKHALQTGQQSGPAPVQPMRSNGPDTIHGDIDCLNLSIWAPAPTNRTLPVMVWFPGGGFMRCDANDALYDGSHFARQGIVMVAVNYRVGVEGFVHVPGVAANRGLRDQMLALEWIRQNIGHFGGDPTRVTVFGQSAGAGALACLMGIPDAAGLFQQAILQSPSVLIQTLDEAGAMTQALADLAGCPPTREGFSSITPKHAAQALARLSADPALRTRYGLGSHHRFALRPVLDGALLAPPLLDAIARSAALPHAVLCGANREEARLYLIPDGAINQITAHDINAFVTDAGLPADTAQIYRQKLPPDQRTDGEVLCAIQSDYYYRTPARDLVETLATRGETAFSYEFSWRSTLYDGALGAAHGVELPFVFNNLHNDTARNFIDVDGPLPLALAQAMQQAWGHFAKHGNPGWPARTPGQLMTMQFDEHGASLRDGDWD